MPALDAGNPGVPAVARVRALLEQLLDESSEAKKTSTVNPALSKSDFKDLCGRVAASFAIDGAPGVQSGQAPQRDPEKARQFAVIETAARDLFYRQIASTRINSPEFVRTWNLLDILSILSDDGQCDPALLFWLVEELLDSQTIDGCSRIFDYLESRRERIIAKHFKQKKLSILRSCNELLRRLSRAEDSAFCGRVFIFMFQSFPLGDRSSVNLRGEYHVENVTTFEASLPENEAKADAGGRAETTKGALDPKSGTKGVSLGSKDAQQSFDFDSLYPLFWPLQESFSQPLKLFDPAHFTKFKSSLNATMKAFQAIDSGDGLQPSKSAENVLRDPSLKKEEEGLDDGLETFNPKYLTSKDLFELEVSDLSFRRHIFVQALIIMDFILSLSAGAKEKLASINASNKAVMYNDQLSEENAKWAGEMKISISDYLKKEPDGPYFNRMVETVLSRDKNWVFWKMASCPPIEREPVSSETFNESKANAQRMATSKRLRPQPMGSVSMDFLRDDPHKLALDNLKSAERYQLPDLNDFKKKIAEDDFEINNPTNAQTKAAAIVRKTSNTWLALRLARATKLAAFDRIDDPMNIDAVFEDLDEDDYMDDDEYVAGVEDMPENRQAIVISGPKGVGKSALVEMLLQRYKGVFSSVVRHTTREAREDEVKGKSFRFVTTQEFNQLRDGDRLIEHGTRDGADYGTSARAVDAILETGRVPVIELDVEAAQFAKDMDFAARYVLISPPGPPALESRLSESGHDKAVIQAVLAKLPEEMDETQVAELFDRTIINDHFEQAAEALGAYLFEKEGQQQEAEKHAAPADVEAEQQGQRDASLAGDAHPGKTAGGQAEAKNHAEEGCIEVKV